MGQQQDLFAADEPNNSSAVSRWSLYRAPKLPEPPPPPLDASERERSLHIALAKAKEQIRELRARLVRADAVAAGWVDVPRFAPTHDARAAQVELGQLIRKILGASDDTSLRAAREEFAQQLTSSRQT